MATQREKMDEGSDQKAGPAQVKRGSSRDVTEARANILFSQGCCGAMATIVVFGACLSKPPEQILKTELAVMRNRVKLDQNKPVRSRVCAVTAPAQTCPVDLGVTGTKRIPPTRKMPLRCLGQAAGPGAELELVTPHEVLPVPSQRKNAHRMTGGKSASQAGNDHPPRPEPLLAGRTPT